MKMTDSQRIAYKWAKNQNYPSVAARYAKELAALVDELQAALMDKYHKMLAPTSTNGDKFRSASDEQIAEILFKLYRSTVEHDGGDIATLWCDLKGGCVAKDGTDLECSEEKNRACILRYLKSEAKVDEI